MRTWVYLDSDGITKTTVYHRNRTNYTWEHPYADRSKCGACLGTSEAAPRDVPKRGRKEEA